MNGHGGVEDRFDAGRGSRCAGGRCSGGGLLRRAVVDRHAGLAREALDGLTDGCGRVLRGAKARAVGGGAFVEHGLELGQRLLAGLHVAVRLLQELRGRGAAQAVELLERHLVALQLVGLRRRAADGLVERQRGLPDQRAVAGVAVAHDGRALQQLDRTRDQPGDGADAHLDVAALGLRMQFVPVLAAQAAEQAVAVGQPLEAALAGQRVGEPRARRRSLVEARSSFSHSEITKGQLAS